MSNVIQFPQSVLSELEIENALVEAFLSLKVSFDVVLGDPMITAILGPDVEADDRPKSWEIVDWSDRKDPIARQAEDISLREIAHIMADHLRKRP